jgi:tetratricopeptide (TPR) repeat protein
MLETVRAYALELLGHGGECQEARDRHAAHFLAFAVSAEPKLRGPEQPAWLDRLEIEHGNLAAAMSWLLERKQLQQAQMIGAMTWRFWWFHGHADEFARFGEHVLAQGEQLPPEQLGMALSGTAFMLIASGEKARAQELFEQGLALSRRSGDKFGIAVTAGALGHLSALRHDYPRAGDLLEESLALQRELGNDESVALVYNFLGQIPLSQGDPERAAELFTQGTEVSRRIPDRFPLLVSLFDLSLSSEDRGDLSEAEAILKEGLSLAVETGDRGCSACYLRRLSTVARAQDRPERGVRLRAAAGALLQSSGSSWLNAYVLPPPADHDALAALRTRMGEAVFDEAWARGASMGFRSAFEYALA